MVSFKVNEHQENIAVFTTRPDTIFGNLYDFGSRASFGSGITTPEYAAKSKRICAIIKTFGENVWLM
jgi:leucyl-tRNA synthetase